MPFRLPGSAFPPASFVCRLSPIRSAVSAILLAFGLAAAQTVELQGGLAFSNPEPALVTVQIHDAHGRLPTRASRARLGAGE